MELAGYEVPQSMQGRSLIKGLQKQTSDATGLGEKLVHDRLAGLGYI
jgi:hypothetical protein